MRGEAVAEDDLGDGGAPDDVPWAGGENFVSELAMSVCIIRLPRRRVIGIPGMPAGSRKRPVEHATCSRTTGLTKILSRNTLNNRQCFGSKSPARASIAVDLHGPVGTAAGADWSEPLRKLL